MNNIPLQFSKICASMERIGAWSSKAENRCAVTSEDPLAIVTNDLYDILVNGQVVCTAYHCAGDLHFTTVSSLVLCFVELTEIAL